jgi:hypothetical protein
VFLDIEGCSVSLPRCRFTTPASRVRCGKSQPVASERVGNHDAGSRLPNESGRRVAPRGPNHHRELAAPLHIRPHASLGFKPPVPEVFVPLRRVASSATTSGSAGHAGATANLKLTFHLDHSTGADHCTPGAKAELPRAAGAARAFH